MAEGSSRMPEGMLSLSWNNHSAAFAQTLATLREKEIYTDVTLACGGKFFPVHKLVLSTCSDYFLQMFERTTCKHPIIVLKDVQCREMEALLRYMYAGIVCVPQSDLTQLIMVAEALQIKGLAVPDETMCTNKRLSHTWSPTDDRISPHAKRLRQGDNGSGTQYQRYSDSQAMIKTQTLTGIPSFSGAVPQSLGYSPSVSSLGKHSQHSIRPTYTTVRYAPYPREVERQQTSPKQIETMTMEEFLEMSKSNRKLSDVKSGSSQTNGSESVVASSLLQTDSDADKEILPETVVKVEVEEGDELVNPEDLSDPPPSHALEADSGRCQLHSKGDLAGGTEREISVGEALEKISDPHIKVEVEEASAMLTSEVVKHRTSEADKLNSCPVASTYQEASENTPPKSSSSVDTRSSWPAGEEDGVHPLDLSDGQKQHTQQQGSPEEIHPKEIKRKLYDNRLLKFPCPYCSYKTPQKSQLSRHILTHAAENPFGCPYCPFRAPLHVSLKEHMNTHKSGSESTR